MTPLQTRIRAKEVDNNGDQGSSRCIQGGAVSTCLNLSALPTISPYSLPSRSTRHAPVNNISMHVLCNARCCVTVRSWAPRCFLAYPSTVSFVAYIFFWKSFRLWWTTVHALPLLICSGDWCVWYWDNTIPVL